jgi:hypothetical protein
VSFCLEEEKECQNGIRDNEHRKKENARKTNKSLLLGKFFLGNSKKCSTFAVVMTKIKKITKTRQ